MSTPRTTPLTSFRQQIEEKFDKRFLWDSCEDCGSFKRGDSTHRGVKEFIRSVLTQQLSLVEEEVKKMKGGGNLRENSLLSPLESYRINDQIYGYDAALSDLLTRIKSGNEERK